MNARRIVCLLTFALLTAPAAALACTDAGPPNRACNDSGAQWIGCTDHAQCPEGQYCSLHGACACGSRDAGVCDDAGCHDCRAWVPWRSDGGDSCDYRVRFWCPAPTVTDAAVDAGGGVVVMDAAVDAGGGVVDAGGGGGGGGGDGCAVRAPGDRAADSPIAVLAALVGLAALARVRRR